MGVAGFVALGAYVSALLTTPPSQGALGGFALPIACRLARGDGRFGRGLGFCRRGDPPATRGLSRHHHLRRRVVVQLVALNVQTLTGGAFGVAFIPRPFDSLAATPALYSLANLALVAIVVAVIYVALERLARSPWGRVLRAIREDERAAMALGKNPARFRLQAFALGGALMGLAGAIGAHFIGFIAPENYASSLTFQVWAMLIVGGSGNNLGAIIGAVLVWALWSASGLIIADLVPASFEARAAALRIVAIGVLLATMIVVRPGGLICEKTMVSRHLDEE